MLLYNARFIYISSCLNSAIERMGKLPRQHSESVHVISLPRTNDVSLPILCESMFNIYLYMINFCTSNFISCDNIIHSCNCITHHCIRELKG